MSSQSDSQGLYLYVKYSNERASELFANGFDNPSKDAYRKDLSTLKIPHPRATKMRLVDNNTVVARWPNTAPGTHQHQLLYTKLVNNTNNALESGHLSALSISLLLVKEIEAEGKNPTLLACAELGDKNYAPSAKRQRLGNSPESMSHSQQQESSEGQAPLETSTTNGLKRTRDGQIIQRPSEAPQAIKLVHGLPPKPPPSTVSSVRSIPAQKPSVVRRVSRLPEYQLEESPFPCHGPADDTQDALIDALKQRILSMEEVSRGQQDLQAQLDRTTKHFQSSVYLRTEVEKALFKAQKGELEAKRRCEELKQLLAEENRMRFDALQNAKASDGRLMAETTKYDRAAWERDNYMRQCELAHEELDRIRPQFEQAQLGLKEEKERRRRYQDRLLRIKRREEELQGKYHDAAQRIAVLSQARDNEIRSARAARERNDGVLRAFEEKLQMQSRAVEDGKNAAQVAQAREEALMRRLEEAEGRLMESEGRLVDAEARVRAERKLRQEAEDALADVRRECREPFVVPSLLDAFLELAQLTTSARRGGVEPDGIAAPAAGATSHAPMARRTTPCKQEPHGSSEPEYSVLTTARAGNPPLPPPLSPVFQLKQEHDTTSGLPIR